MNSFQLPSEGGGRENEANFGIRGFGPRGGGGGGGNMQGKPVFNVSI